MKRKLHYFTLLLGALIALINAPAFADRTPEWMVGRFESDVRSNGRTISVRIDSEGRMIATLQGNSQRTNTIDASYRRDILTIDDRDYTVVRTADGFRAVPDRSRSNQGNDRNRQDNDRFAQIFFHRTDITNDPVRGDRVGRLPGNRDQAVPEWMTGQFEGTSRRDSPSINLRINSDGTMSATSRGSRQNSERLPIAYRRGVLTIDNTQYRVEQANNGFLAIPSNDRASQSSLRNGQIAFRRIGDAGDDRQGNRGGSRVPDWMIGRFEGYSRRDDQTISLRVRDDGGVSLTSRGNGQNSQRAMVSYRRSTLTINDRDYTVERTSDGFRAIPTGDSGAQRSDRNSQINFRRIGD